MTSAINIQYESRYFDEAIEFLDETYDLVEGDDIDEYSNYATTPRGKSVKFAEQERRKGIQVRQIEKDFERKNREPMATNLGKTAKKIAGRRAVVMELVNMDQERVFEESEKKTAPKTATFKRIRRKQGHRERLHASDDSE